MIASTSITEHPALDYLKVKASEEEFRSVARNGNIEALRAIWCSSDSRNGTDSILLKPCPFTGKTAAHFAAENGHANVLRFLHSLGDPFTAVDHDGKTAGVFAANEKCTDVFELVSLEIINPSRLAFHNLTEDHQSMRKAINNKHNTSSVPPAKAYNVALTALQGKKSAPWYPSSFENQQMPFQYHQGEIQTSQASHPVPWPTTLFNFVSNNLFPFGRIKAVEFMDMLVENGYSLEMAESVAENGMTDTDQGVRTAAIQLFSKLFERGHSYLLAANVAAQGMTNTDKDIRWDAIKLFKSLFEKHHGFEQAANVAAAGMTDTDPDVRSAALNLYKALAEKYQDLEQAIEAAEQGAADSDARVRCDAIELYKAFVEMDENFEQAVNAAVKGKADTDAGVRSKVLGLFMALVEKGQSFEQAANVALKGMADTDAGVRSKVLELFMALVDKEYGFEQAASAAVKGMNDSDNSVRSRISEMCKRLIEKNQGFVQAVLAAEKGMNCDEQLVQDRALGLYNALVAKGQGFEKAASAAEKGMDGYMTGKALELYLALVEKGQYYEKAVSAAESKREIYSNSCDSLKLFRKLFEKSLGFEQASKVAKEKIQYSDSWDSWNGPDHYNVKPRRGKRLCALELYTALVERGRYYEEAAATGLKELKDPDKQVQKASKDLLNYLKKAPH